MQHVVAVKIYNLLIKFTLLNSSGALHCILNLVKKITEYLLFCFILSFKTLKLNYILSDKHNKMQKQNYDDFKRKLILEIL